MQLGVWQGKISTAQKKAKEQRNMLVEILVKALELTIISSV